MKNKRENEKEKERKDKPSHNISSYTTKSIMLTRACYKLHLQGVIFPYLFHYQIKLIT